MVFLLRVVALAILTAILASLLGPATMLERQTPGFDKVAHFFAFGLALWSFGVLFPNARRVVLAFWVALVGGQIEVLQGVIGRDADWLDFAADAAGVAAALLAWEVWRRFKPRSARAGSQVEG